MISRPLGRFNLGTVEHAGVKYVFFGLDREARESFQRGGALLPSSEAHRLACSLLAVLEVLAAGGDEEAQASLELTEATVRDLRASVGAGVPPGEVPGGVE